MKLQELYEAVSKANVDSAMKKIISYIERSLDTQLVRIFDLEQFKNSTNSGYGSRYVFLGTTQCIRFNWETRGSAGKAAEIDSIDIWSGKSSDPSYNVKTSGASLVKVLPSLVKLLRSPKVGVYPAFSANDSLSESLLEAKRGDYSAEGAIKDFLKRIARGDSFTRSEFIGVYHISNVGIFDAIMRNMVDSFEVEGKRRISMSPDVDPYTLYDEIVKLSDVEFTVTPGGSDETYEPTKEEEEIEEEAHVSFNDTLEHLESLTIGLAKGSFNALMVCGAGGTGKTQTVEDTLEKLGLSDGSGYFKNTGTASPFGIYEMLYKNRNNIVLFDDSDGALADQDGRNLIKAATDTKKKRKLAWSKKNSKLYDPALGVPQIKKSGKNSPVNDDDEFGDVDIDDDMEDKADMIPSYFDFEGRIIFISNLPLNKLDPDGALRTRAFIISINPTKAELLERMEQIMDSIKLEAGHLTHEQRREVLEVIKGRSPKKEMSLRTLVRSLNLAASGVSNWRKLVELYG